MTNQSSRPVVAGVDGSAESRAAVDWAAREAERRHTRLRLVHGYIQPAALSTFGYPAQDYQIEVPLHAARALLAGSADRVRAAHPEVPVDRVLLGGVPAGVLVYESDTVGRAVVGARGRGGFCGPLPGC